MINQGEHSQDKANKVVVPELSGRRRVMLAGFMLAMCFLLYRAFDLQVLNNSFLQNKGDAVHLSDIAVPAYRGKITDRVGHALAISAPVGSVWINPQEFDVEDKKKTLLKLLGITEKTLNKKSSKKSSRRFVYLRRHMDPQAVKRIGDLGLPGIYVQKEYRRYYPDGEIAAHLVGLTNVDNKGQEGLELALEKQLRGVSGVERVLRDGKRRMVKHIDSVRAPIAGQKIALTIDRRLQYLAYRELKAAVAQQKAKAGSLVLMDPKTGEILAVANQPAFNPNDRSNIKPGDVRNRAFVDVFEPGSIMKPFTVAAGMESGLFDSHSIIDTSPGFMRIGNRQVRDHRNYGKVDLATLLLKSSNVGSSKVALEMPPEKFWGLLNGLGFGRVVGSQFPGEAKGKLVEYQNWRPFGTATLSFGYGLSASVLQLTQAYGVLANNGFKQPIALIKDIERADGEQVMSAKVAAQIRGMLQGVVSKAGTAPRASVQGYSVAGKTGTVKKAIAGGYAEDKYLGIFAGMAPAKNPKLVMVVMIDEPTAGDYYGGLVAAPVFSRVMSGALRIMNVAPDQVDKPAVLEIAMAEGKAR